MSMAALFCLRIECVASGGGEAAAAADQRPIWSPASAIIRAELGRAAQALMSNSPGWRAATHLADVHVLLGIAHCKEAARRAAGLESGRVAAAHP